MSESQFAYEGFTLDELRSLAASPQVGSMQAMPESFRALADRVGEVADLLSHAQADLPNWWKGAAAEQAAATLGRAAAEAREFHGSALAAATAVGRCAQVVAEQQHQMMNVPDVAEPGVTAVVQRPATSFEALEAARQDANYQAAHEQAVQVVNGIAAQYIETHAQLSSIGFKFDKGFTPIEESNVSNFTGDSSKSHPSTTQSAVAEFPQPGEHRYQSLRHHTTPKTPSRKPASLTALQAGDHGFESASRESSASKETGYAPRSFDLVDAPASHKSPPGTLKAKAEALGATPETFTAAKETAPAFSSNEGTITNSRWQTRADDDAIHKEQATNDQKSLSTVESAKPFHRTTDTTGEGAPTSAAEEHFLLPQVANGDAVPPQPKPQQTPQSQREAANDESAAMIPPFSGLGSIHRTREERNPRPAYLKERKSVWVSTTIAAPADGVIGPDWSERP
ncbi:hypothetical protein ABH926_000291 [Catenulispora sp. GP43]|uniref:hypothetical protein n=1 Tax=Catenulispora sp. GP43 TaxID=3156263 RepID=UPI0035163A32